MNTVFMTGGTGLIGGKLAYRILSGDPSARLILLVRGDCEIEARQRVEAVIRVLSPDYSVSSQGRRLTVICGDITQKQLGIVPSTFDRLASQVTHIVHSAAATKFHLPLDHARRVNCTGTENVMTFAQRTHAYGRLRGVAHISTAYVCGDRGGMIYDYDFDEDPVHSNSYELSKWEAERYVRSLMSELPITVFRPSIVVGDSRTGRTTAFNVLYAPLRYIYDGLLTSLSCPHDTPLDVVPVDYVADTVHHILLQTKDHIGKTYNIVAGPSRSDTVGAIVQHAVSLFNRAACDELTRRVEFIPEELQASGGLSGRMSRLLMLYRPYLAISRGFGDANTAASLRSTGIRASRFLDYIDTILNFCLVTGWGKHLRKAA